MSIPVSKWFEFEVNRNDGEIWSRLWIIKWGYKSNICHQEQTEHRDTIQNEKITDLKYSTNIYIAAELCLHVLEVLVQSNLKRQHSTRECGVSYCSYAKLSKTFETCKICEVKMIPK